MSSRILPRRMNAMNIQQVAASEEFSSDSLATVAPVTDKKAVRKSASSSSNNRPSELIEESIHRSLSTVGQGIQSLLSDSLNSTTSRMSEDLQSMSKQLDSLAQQNASLKRTNEEQRKVIVALVKKLGTLESHATAASRNQQRTDQRLAALEQPADLDSEWKQLLDSKSKPEPEDSDSAS